MTATLTESPRGATARSAGDDGLLTIQDYFEISERGWELVDGRLERLPVPTDLHRDLIGFLYDRAHCLSSRRKVKFCGYKLSTIDGRGREPDLLYVADLDK